MRSWATVIDQLNACLGRLCSWLVLLMIIVGAWNVVGRHLGPLVGRNLSSNSLIEVQWYLFSLTFLLGGAWTMQRNGHVRVDVLQSRWGARRKALANVVGTILLLFPFCLLLILSSWDAVHFSWRILEQSPDPGGLPRYPLKTVLPLSFLLLMLQGIADVIHNMEVIRSFEKKRKPW
ncbi:TRAP dicarboxylate transporter, DctQ subunit,unknown substrate 6 [Candidatus Synechococcus spongiarum]|uniref:Tripartite ATP-independent periplasmic transporters DctQ component domain-containing protein n=2 Tax=Candidatus Synechococcus spongiarum TaxID=431041 RepID=A0A164YV56_9SYNE|nr:TRAP dicarboxylate transporter, DctQ subunit,unknown substrate 6 [Candidatus Synechococcus spongiarum]